MTVTRIENWTPTIPVTIHTFRRSELGGDHTMGGGEGGGSERTTRNHIYTYNISISKFCLQRPREHGNCNWIIHF